MQNLSEHSSPQRQTPPLSGPILIYQGFTLVITFAIGLAIGFLGRPIVLQDVPIEVAVTVVANSSGEAVAQVPASTPNSTNSTDMSHTTEAMSEAGASPPVTHSSGKAIAQAPTSTPSSMNSTDMSHTTEAMSEANTSSSEPTREVANPASEPTSAPPTPTLMDFVLTDARHFQGSDTAPITIIEFSDFK